MEQKAEHNASPGSFSIDDSHCSYYWGVPGGSDSKDSTRTVGDPGSTPGSGRSSGAGNGYPLQYSCLESPMDREARWVAVHGVAKSRT